MTKADWKNRQKRLNLFTNRRLRGVGPIRVDGIPGPSTRQRIKDCKFWLGWEYKNCTSHWSSNLAWHLRNPLRKGDYKSYVPVRRGVQRRRRHDLAWLKSHTRSGVTTWRGTRVATVTVPVLDWCKAHGWRGWVVSGYRDPNYSQSLCYRMCGRPSCPGTCAGKSSNHVGSTITRFAVDVSYYDDYRRIVANCPLRPRMYNHLPRDPVHFSANGY